MISIICIIVRVCGLQLRAAPVRLREAQAASPGASPRTQSVTLDLAGNTEMSVITWTRSEEADAEGQGITILCGQARQEGEELPTWPEASERQRGPAKTSLDSVA